MNELQPVVMEGVEIAFHNFAGKEDPPYNREGDRNFSIRLPEDVARAMQRDGWNVKIKDGREDGDDPRIHIDIAVSYKVRPPKIWIQNSRGRRMIGEDEVETLDYMDIENLDVIINPFKWGPNAMGQSGIKAYLGTMFVTIHEDALEAKYADVPIVHG